MSNATCRECGTEFRRVTNGRYCSIECRFLTYVSVGDPDECWEWKAAHDRDGYGRFAGRYYAHRYAYELAVGSIPEGLQLDHLCRNRGCVNPDHLEAVTSKENTLRGEAPNIVVARTNVCQRGHSMDDAILKPRGVRACRTCHNLRRSKSGVLV